MEKLRAEFGPKIKSSSSILSSVNLETNLLELFCRGILVPNQAELTLEVFDQNTLTLSIFKKKYHYELKVAVKLSELITFYRELFLKVSLQHGSDQTMQEFKVMK